MATLAATIARGTLAARPATMPAGSLYYVTDTSTLYRSNGATWDSIEAAAATGYTDEQARDAIGTALVAGSGITVTVNDPSDTITIASAVSAAAAATPNWISGRWYGVQEVGSATVFGGSALVANLLCLAPVLVPKATPVDRIGANVTAAVASTTIRLGIYGDFAASGIASLLLDAGTIDSSTTGNKELTISQVLPPGWLWLAVISNGTPAMTALSSWSGANLQGQANTGGTAKTPLWTKSGTGGFAALPSTFALSGATAVTSGPIPMVRAT